MADTTRASIEITRRQLLLGGTAAVLVGWAGCSDGEGDGPIDAGTTTTRPPPPLEGDPFVLGVASGDPRPTSVVLWTRLAVDPLAADGLGGMPDEEVDVAWEVATDAEFEDIVATGIAVASPEHAHAVHAEATGLAAGADHHFRFRVRDHLSTAGRTRTLPEGSPERFGIAVVNCQWFEVGHYGAYRHLAEDDTIDLVLHLGDYIYEYPGATEGARQTLPAKQLETLTDYRLRYASYRMDEHLRAAHARLPFVLTWDDHEVSNNYSGDGLRELPGDADAFEARRSAAYQAWWEHLPVRAEPPSSGGGFDVHHHVDVGDLARIYVLDQRQHADAPPCRDGDPDAEDFGDCAERTTGDRAFLGEAQEAWFAETSDASRARWNLIGNPVVLAGVDAGNDADGTAYYLDSWDGYPTARHRFIEQLARIENPVVLTGDYHAAMVLDVDERPFEAGSAHVAPELMAPPISSPLFAADVSARTPQLRRQVNGHGYLAVEVTPDRVVGSFRIVDDVQDPETAIRTRLTCTVESGDPVPTLADA